MPLSINKLRAITGAVVVTLAAGSGYFMQQSASVRADRAPGEPEIAAQVAPPQAALVAARGPAAPQSPQDSEIPPAVPEVTRAAARPLLLIPGPAPLLPATPAAPQPQAPVRAVAPARAGPADIAATNPARECEVGFTALAGRGAMVELTLEAPCYGGQIVEFFHADIRFSATLDPRGLVWLNVPALEEDAVFTARFADGRTETTEILMLTMSDYSRTALSWQGPAALGLYALENGAEYGAPGMVSAAQPYGPERALAGDGGFMTMLGEGGSGYRSMVYSWPLRLGDTGPAPEISIEAEILAENCDREIRATLSRAGPGPSPALMPVFMAAPGCDAVGSYLVLKNLPQAVRIATK